MGAKIRNEAACIISLHLSLLLRVTKPPPFHQLSLIQRNAKAPKEGAHIKIGNFALPINKMQVHLIGSLLNGNNTCCRTLLQRHLKT